MNRVLMFPKQEFRDFNEGIKCFNANQYEKAIILFEKAKRIEYLKKECLKYLIDCHIGLNHFDEVYRIIENEFTEQNLDEDYLLKKYLYTMVLEEQYIEATELIKIYKKSQHTSRDLRRYLDELTVMIEDKVNERSIKRDFIKYFSSNDFEDHLEIICNLEYLDVKKYEHEINNFLSTPEHDAFIKYQLLQYIMEHRLLEEVKYVNYYQETFLIRHENFIDILTHEVIEKPLETVLKHLNNESVNESLLRNIWTDFCLKYYPHIIFDMSLASSILHLLTLKSLNITYNIVEICDLYQVDIKRLFNYFRV